MTTFTAQQQSVARSLYRQLLKTQSSTFQNHPQAILAAKLETRNQFQKAKANNKGHEQIEAGFNLAKDVVTLLKMNVVQGKWSEGTGAWKLNLTPETELGSNESVKQGRSAQLEALKASKGKLSCSSPRAFSTSSTFNSTTTRSFTTTSSPNLNSSYPIQNPSTSKLPLPRPVPTHSNITLLSDGSSIQLNTTNPKLTTRLARDPTNHPLWNPGMEVSRALEGGRTGRFRRRFGGDEKDSTSPTSQQQQQKGESNDGIDILEAGIGNEKSVEMEKKSERKEVKFEKDDLDWMTGGREAKASSVASKAKPGKGGKKK